MEGVFLFRQRRFKERRRVSDLVLAIHRLYFVSIGLSVPSLSREERRWLEKQNKADRQQRKKEEMTRLRLLVGKVFNKDKARID